MERDPLRLPGVRDGSRVSAIADWLETHIAMLVALISAAISDPRALFADLVA